MEYISGVDKGQVIMLPDCVDDYVGAENPVRVIDAYIESLELSDLGFHRAQPNETGRPSYSPKDLLKLYLYGYMNRIRSSRRLEAETVRNLEVIWLMGKAITGSQNDSAVPAGKQRCAEERVSCFCEILRRAGSVRERTAGH